jgi:parvulin-like peptidyl-prolyl isomerase
MHPTAKQFAAMTMVLLAAFTLRAAAPLFDDPVVARGKGIEIKRGQVDDAFTAFKANLAARGTALPEEQRAIREAQLLDKLIVTQLLVNRANTNDQAKAREVADKFFIESRKAAASEESFARQIRALGMTLTQFTNRTMEQALSEAVLERELKSKLTATDAQVEEFYRTGADLAVRAAEADLEKLAKDPNVTLGKLTEGRKQIDEFKKANLAKLEQPERVRVSHVLLATRAKDTEEDLPDAVKRQKREQIDKLLTRARAGEDFARLIEQHSEDRGVKETHGEYTFSRNDPFVPEFKAAAFSLQTNQISDVVTTMFGYHILKLHEKIPAKKLELEKVAKDIKDFLVQQEMQKQMPDYLARIKQDANVEILDEKYKAALAREAEAGAGK